MYVWCVCVRVCMYMCCMCMCVCVCACVCVCVQSFLAVAAPPDSNVHFHCIVHRLTVDVDGSLINVACRKEGQDMLIVMAPAKRSVQQVSCLFGDSF